MKCARRAGVLLVSLLVACTSGPSPPGHQRPSPSVTHHGSPVTLPRLILTADLSQRPPAWRRVLSIPFGGTRDTLGFVPVGGHTPVPYVPMAFAAASDGSFWFLDPVKDRLAHYSSTGDFLGQIGGIRFDRFHTSPRDIAMVRATPVVLQFSLDDDRAFVLVPGGNGFASVSPHDATTSLLVSNLIQTTDPSASAAIGQVEGRPFRMGEPVIPHPRGVADLGLSSKGRVRYLPGLPLGDGNFVRLRFVDFVDVEARFVTPSGATSVLPIQFRLEARDRTISALASAEFQTALDHGVACLIQIAPDSPKDAGRYRGGRWFLELSDDGSPLVWERLRTPNFDDEGVVRHLAVGPDGSVYLMQVHAKGVSIYKR